MERISWETFNSFLQSKYMFHIHTLHTDGHASVLDYVHFAVEKGIKTIIFTEHVRKNMLYDFHSLISEIAKAKEAFADLEIIAGAEAKILPNGGLDFPPALANVVDVVCIACHSFPPDAELYFSVMENIFVNLYRDKIRVWVHPGMFYGNYGTQLKMKKGRFKERMSGLVRMADENFVYGENNLRYDLPGTIFPAALFKYRITGTDAHGLDELKQYYQ